MHEEELLVIAEPQQPPLSVHLHDVLSLATSLPQGALPSHLETAIYRIIADAPTRESLEQMITTADNADLSLVLGESELQTVANALYDASFPTEQSPVLELPAIPSAEPPPALTLLLEDAGTQTITSAPHNLVSTREQPQILALPSMLPLPLIDPSDYLEITIEYTPAPLKNHSIVPYKSSAEAITSPVTVIQAGNSATEDRQEFKQMMQAMIKRQEAQESLVRQETISHSLGSLGKMDLTRLRMTLPFKAGMGNQFSPPKLPWIMRLAKQAEKEREIRPVLRLSAYKPLPTFQFRLPAPVRTPSMQMGRTALLLLRKLL